MVDLPLWKYDFVSWDDDIPNWMESHKSHVPNHQPDMVIWRFPKSWGYPKLAGWFMSWKIHLSINGWYLGVPRCGTFHQGNGYWKMFLMIIDIYWHNFRIYHGISEVPDFWGILSMIRQTNKPPWRCNIHGLLHLHQQCLRRFLRRFTLGPRPRLLGRRLQRLQWWKSPEHDGESARTM